jgi:hypothetical protein
MKKGTKKKVKAAVSAVMDEDWEKECKDWKNKSKCEDWKCHGSGGCFYFLGFLGAAVYYIGAAATFWGGVLGFLKACVWPAFLVHALLAFLGA